MDLETDPGKIFKSVKGLLGNNKQKAPYLQDRKNKILEPKDKETLFREHWKNIFRSDQED